MVRIAAKRAIIHIMESDAVPPAIITQTTVLRLTAILPTDAKIIVRVYLKSVRCKQQPRINEYLALPCQIYISVHLDMHV